MDAGTGEIAAHVLTDGDADDAAQSPALLRQCEGAPASVTADGAYDRDPVYQAAAARQPGPPPEVVIHPGPTPRWAQPIRISKPRATATSSSWPSAAASAGNGPPGMGSATTLKRQWAATST